MSHASDNEASELLTFDGAQCAVWRTAPAFQGLRTAAIGRLVCETAADGARALIAVCQRLAGEGVAAVLGPMEGDTWSPYRLAVSSNGRAAFFLEPHTPPHVPDAFDQAGFERVAYYASAARSTVEPVAAPSLPDGLAMRTLRPEAFDDELARIFAVSTKAFAGNLFYTPISFDAFAEKYRPLGHLIDPELVVLVEDHQGALQGFLFGVPDLAAADPTSTVIMKTWASLASGAGMAMAEALYLTAQRKGAKEVINALFHDEGRSAALNARQGGEIFRRYALWGRVL